MNTNEKIIEKLEREKEIIEKAISRLNTGEEVNTDEFRSLLNNMYNKHLLLITLEELSKINEKIDSINTTNTCRLNDENTNNMMKMIVATQSTKNKEQARNRGHNELRKFTSNAKDLVVIDPYIFKANMGIFANVSNIKDGGISSLHIIYCISQVKFEPIVN